MNRPFTIEVIGPAGSGKSTLMTLLSERAEVRTGLSIWKLPAPLLAKGAICSVSDLLSARGLKWEETKLVIQTHALRLLLRRQVGSALFLDEGSVFALAKLLAFNDRTAELVQRLSRHVAPVLDAVVWLDAPDHVLAARIRERSKFHRVKTSTDKEIFEHLARYRRAFDAVVEGLSRCASIKVTKFNTAEETLDRIADNILRGVGSRIVNPETANRNLIAEGEGTRFNLNDIVGSPVFAPEEQNVYRFGDGVRMRSSGAQGALKNSVAPTERAALRKQALL